MTIQEATYYILNKLRTIYADGEASQVTDWVMESLTGSKKAERMIYKNSAITTKEEVQLQEIVHRLMTHEPVQYVLHEAWFCGAKFYVDKNVLIPRPETEELVEWLLTDLRSQKPGAGNIGNTITILDIGTGSGCIPVTLKRKLPSAEVWTCDISDTAIEVAKRNAGALGADIHFLLLDFLDKKQWDHLPLFDLIISNPPYVPEKDKLQMAPNVLNFEPYTALFVPDNDPLVFYKAIAEFGKSHLKRGGGIYAEIHEDLAEAVSALFNSLGYRSELKKDIHGKERMLKAGTG